MADQRFKNTAKVLDTFGKNVTDRSFANQKKNPIKVIYQFKLSANSFEFNFISPYYARFQDQGVAGHGNGNWSPIRPKTNQAPLSPFKYVTGPGTQTILESMVSKPSFRTRDLETGQFTPKTPSNMNSAAFLIARSIGRFGVKPKYFFTNAIEDFGPKLVKDLGSAWVKDQEPFIDSLQKAFIKPE